MASLFSVEEVLLALQEESDQLIEDEESDFEGEGVFSYASGLIAEAGLGVGDVDVHEEEDALPMEEDEENTAQPVPTESRDLADGEY